MELFAMKLYPWNNVYNESSPLTLHEFLIHYDKRYLNMKALYKSYEMIYISYETDQNS